MNRLYYSNNCKHCEKLLLFLKRSNLLDKIDFYCVDNRIKENNIYYIVSNDYKTKSIMPPNISEIPALILISDKHRAIFGQQIVEYYSPTVNVNNLVHNLEPQPFLSSSNSNLTGSQYGVVASNKKTFIETPEDTFVKNKVTDQEVENFTKCRDRDIEYLLSDTREQQPL